MRRISFEIPGEPVGKGRPRFVTKGRGGKPLPFPMVYTPVKTKEYEAKVITCFLEIAKKRLLIEGAVSLSIYAHYGIAKSGTKAIKELKESQKKPVLKKPDADNVMKIIKDALNNVAYKDDAQVTEAAIEKKWSYDPHVSVLLQWDD